MISGMRKLPPISMSWPRETITSFPWQRARKAMTVAAALLLTAVADSAPVSRQTHSRMASCRLDRVPVSRSSSRLRYAPAASCAACAASSAIGARPRLVCSTMPVALITVHSFGRNSRSSRSQAASAITSAVGTPSIPAVTRCRHWANSSRMAATTSPWLWRCRIDWAAGVSTTSLTDGSCRNGLAGMWSL